MKQFRKIKKIATSLLAGTLLSLLLTQCGFADLNEFSNSYQSDVSTQVEVENNEGASKNEASKNETNIDTSNDNSQLIPSDQSQATNTNQRPHIEDSIINEQISIKMLDVGQGLSVLIESGGEYMLYDGGGRGYSSYVVSYLKKHNINHLKYMIASHYDEDHINGLVGVLNTTQVEQVLNPNYEATTKIYHSYINKLNANGAKKVYPNVGDKFTLGNATFTILSPSRKYDEANDMSIAIKITCGNFSCLITGDAEREAEYDMLKGAIDLKSDVYIVGHHGSASSTTEAFLKEVNPSVAFISVGKDNRYNHPSSKVIERLNKHNVKIYRSDESGEVTCTSNGTKMAIEE